MQQWLYTLEVCSCFTHPIESRVLSNVPDLYSQQFTLMLSPAGELGHISSFFIRCCKNTQGQSLEVLNNSLSLSLSLCAQDQLCLVSLGWWVCHCRCSVPSYQCPADCILQLLLHILAARPCRCQWATEKTGCFHSFCATRQSNCNLYH